SLDMCSATEIIDIVAGHQFVLSRKKGIWKRIENSGWKNTAEFKQAEKALSESEEKYQTLFNSIDEGFCIIEMIFDANGKPVDYRFLETNSAFEKQTGLHEATGKTMLELVPNHEEYWFETYGNIVLTGEPKRFINEAKPLMGGWFDVCAFQFGGRESNRVAILFNDVTERKKADVALQKTCDNLEEKVKKRTFELDKSYNSLLENDIRLNEAQKIAHIGNWDWNLLTNRVFWSDELYRIFGRDPREPGASFDELLNYIHSDDRDYVSNVVKEALSGKPLNIDSRLILANGEKCIIHLQGEFIFNEENAPVRMRGTIQDITESKKAEEKIQNMATVVESSNDAIITESLDGIITTWNKGAEQIYGYSAKEVVGKPISILEPSTLTEETKELAELITQGDRIHHYETLRLRKNGKIINVSLTISPIFDASEKLISILVIARDITRSKIAEENLRKNEERYRIATEQTGQVIYEYDLRTDKSTWAGAIEEVTGYSFEEIQKLGKEIWLKNIHFTDMDRGEVKYQSVRKTGGRFKEELRLRKKDGTCIYIENRGIWLTDYEGKPYGAVGVLKDISEIKFAIKNLEDGERKYRSFIHNFYGIAFQLDENFVPVFLHGAVEEITGYSEEEFMSRIKWEDIIHPDDLSLVLKEEEKSRSSPAASYKEIEYRIKHRDGRIRWVNEIYQKIQREDGKPEFYQGTIYDTTEKKETENFLANIETARKKEIHHRIKNNLQVISSLLDLQAEKFNNREFIKDSEILEAFRESQDRVISMALIHEELYKGEGFDTLNFSLYVEKLVENLFQTYRLENTDIRLDLDLEVNIFLDMDTAVPLGIIINELVSNSLKHAFVDRDNGKIQIKLCKENSLEEDSKESKDNRAGSNNEGLKYTNYIMTVLDNGVGVPEGFDLENPDDLGIQLVTTLVDQLEGRIELKRDNGTEFIIRFTAA
ncbi:MAG: PAS domain S-box protein, partial [Methanosarcina sp.]|nr:PAS domain S-box protein [Methanosarcina sp.]